MKSRTLRRRVADDKIPPWVVLVDTETVNVGDGQQQLLLGCFEVWKVSEKTGIPRFDQGSGQHHRDPYMRGHFTDEGELYRLLRGLGQSRCVAHNWQFDASVIRLGSASTRRKYGYMMDMEACSFPIDKGYTPFNVTISWGGDAFTQFICNTNFHKTSLAALGESYGIAKLEMPPLDKSLLDQLGELRPEYDRMDSTVMGHFKGSPIFEVLRYCRRDVEVLRESWFSLFRFSHEMVGTTPGITVASMAKRLFCVGWLGQVKQRHEKIVGSLQFPGVAAAEEAAYRGGRADMFWEGRPKPGLTLRKYDVVSMYPSIMLGDVPVEFKGVTRKSHLYKYLYGGTGPVTSGGRLFLAKVTVNVPPEGRGWLGWEGEKITRRGLVFGAGRWTTWAWQPMLQIAMEEGWVEEIHEVLAYRACPLFRQYINDIYALRAIAKKEKNAPRSLLLKYAMNTLYGKFGQGRFGKWVETSGEDANWQNLSRGQYEWDRWQDFPRGDPSMPLTDYLRVDGKIWAFEPGGPGMGENSVCSIAGYITSGARAKLWYALASLVDQGAGVYMVDTDSIITDGVLPEEMVGNQLGQWELEDSSPSEDCIFNAPKDYVFSNKAKCKGIRKPEPGIRDYEQVRFSRWQTQLLSRDEATRESLEKGAKVTMIAKHVSGANNKRNSRGKDQANDPIVWEGNASP